MKLNLSGKNERGVGLADVREASLRNLAGSGPFGSRRKEPRRSPLSLEEAIAHRDRFFAARHNATLSITPLSAATFEDPTTTPDDQVLYDL